MAAAVPAGIRGAGTGQPLEPLGERPALDRLRAVLRRNTPGTAMIGLGYHPTATPAVVRRNVLEDPSWYTAYTPYQPEISQGRLEALLNFQTMIGDLTGLPTANASLLDEATAAAEAMTLVRRGLRGEAATRPFVVDADCLPQTLAVVHTRARGLGIEVIEADLSRRAARGRPRRCAGRLPGRVRRGPRPAPGHRGDARARRPGRRRGRPAGAVPAGVAGRARRRRRRGFEPALRRADVVRRTARRVHGGARRPQPAPARPAGRRLGRRGGTRGLPARAADPRAAHPARQGHLQHLHRAGAARRRGVDVRGLPRSRRAAGDRAAGAPLRRGAGGRAARGRGRGHDPGVLRHRRWHASPAGPRRSWLRPAPTVCTCDWSTATTWA